MFDLAITTIAMLAAAAFAAGFVDSIAGGGGLISVPALLLAGFTPVESLGTNKLQGLFGTGSATLAYAASGQVDPRRQWRAAVLSFFGAALGALAATRVPDDILRAALPIVLIAIALYFALKPNLADVDRAERLSPLRFSATLVPLIGFYDGVFGPGAGSFFMLAFVALAGYGVLKATAHTKLLNFASNIAGLGVLIAGGHVLWLPGLAMAVASMAGGQLGAHAALRFGAGAARPLLIIVSLALTARLLADPANPLTAHVLSLLR